MTAAARKTSEAAFRLPMPCPGRGKRGTASAMTLHTNRAKVCLVSNSIQIKPKFQGGSRGPALLPDRPGGSAGASSVALRQSTAGEMAVLEVYKSGRSVVSPESSTVRLTHTSDPNGFLRLATEGGDGFAMLSSRCFLDEVYRVNASELRGGYWWVV